MFWQQHLRAGQGGRGWVTVEVGGLRGDDNSPVFVQVARALASAMWLCSAGHRTRLTPHH